MLQKVTRFFETSEQRERRVDLDRTQATLNASVESVFGHYLGDLSSVIEKMTSGNDRVAPEALFQATGNFLFNSKKLARRIEELQDSGYPGITFSEEFGAAWERLNLTCGAIEHLVILSRTYSRSTGRPGEDSAVADTSSAFANEIAEKLLGPAVRNLESAVKASVSA